MKLLYIHLVILSFTLTLAAPASSDDTIDLEEEIDKLCHQLGTRNRHVSMFGTIVSSITSFFPKTEPEPFHLTKEGIDDALHILDNTLKKAGVAKYLKKGEHIDLIPYGDFWAVHEFKTRPHAESIDTYWELYHEEGAQSELEKLLRNAIFYCSLADPFFKQFMDDVNKKAAWLNFDASKNYGNIHQPKLQEKYRTLNYIQIWEPNWVFQFNIKLKAWKQTDYEDLKPIMTIHLNRYSDIGLLRELALLWDKAGLNNNERNALIHRYEKLLKDYRNSGETYWYETSEEKDFIELPKGYNRSKVSGGTPRFSDVPEIYSDDDLS